MQWPPAAGSNSDAGIFSRSIIPKSYLDRTLETPAPSYLPGSTSIKPYVF